MFSLLDSGIIDRPSCKLLLIDGFEDTIFPIEDHFLVAGRGKNKELLVRANVSHMGEPGCEQLMITWLDNVLSGNPSGIGMPA